MKDREDTERYIVFSAGLILGIILGYTGILGFLTGVCTGIFVGHKYDIINKMEQNTGAKKLNKT